MDSDDILRTVLDINTFIGDGVSDSAVLALARGLVDERQTPDLVVGETGERTDRCEIGSDFGLCVAHQGFHVLQSSGSDLTLVFFDASLISGRLVDVTGLTLTRLLVNQSLAHHSLDIVAGSRAQRCVLALHLVRCIAAQLCQPSKLVSTLAGMLPYL